MSDEARRDQLERALGTWQLVIGECPADAQRFALLRRTLRMKSMEADGLRSRLPGPVRRGARRDLQPLLERLEDLGFPATLERRSPGSD